MMTSDSRKISSADSSEWSFWLDVGGTFTDCVAHHRDGQILRRKVLSSGAVKGQVGPGSQADQIHDPSLPAAPAGFWGGYRFRLLDTNGSPVAESFVAREPAQERSLVLHPPLAQRPESGQAFELLSGEEAPILAIRSVLGLRLDDPLPDVRVSLGTTRGTNALLTRRGASTGLVVTRGFADILHIGYQNRPRLFDLTIRKPEPLFAAVAEIDERINATGEVLATPRTAPIREALIQLRQQGIESLAICLLHAWRNPVHEQFVANVARELGFADVSLSSQVAPVIKLVARGDTTTLDAYLTPVLRSYLERLESAFRREGSRRLRVLTSAGGMLQASHFRGKDSILSGPAGGVVGFSRVARAAGFQRSLGFDMGGTSTDVSRFDGHYELEYETEKAGVRVVTPMMAIETVAAGGGSICRFDGDKLVVGPESAAADPGPACYGRGGPLTVTDANFFLGRIRAEHFPFALDRAAMERRLNEIAQAIEASTGRCADLPSLAEGFLRVANVNMARALRAISLAKGFDPRDYVLVPFGGAGPQHACAVAEELGISQILNHPDAGVLSAYGIGLADVVRHEVAGIYAPDNPATRARLGEIFDRLTGTAARQVEEEGIDPAHISVRRFLDVRYQGLDAYLTIPFSAESDHAEAFRAEHQRRYGYVHENRALEIVAARVEAMGQAAVTIPPTRPSTDQRTTQPAEWVDAFFRGRFGPTALYRRGDLRPGDRVFGPAIIAEEVATTVVEPDWVAEMLSGGELLLTTARTVAQLHESRLSELDDEPDPVLLEVFNHHFAGIAEQMGVTLRNTSSSVNVKERLDFSCAIFSSTGDLVVNAPHIPVHLGAMSETVKRVLADNTDLRPGDVIVTNDPYRGGSHLPDVTVVTPVHEVATGELLFCTASRAHHAEIGGITPGSMPPHSKNLAEEGVLIRNFRVVDGGISRFDDLRKLLSEAPFPSRSVNDNLADLAAQIAANRQGADNLERLVARYSLPVVQAYMRHMQTAAERKVRRALAKLGDGSHTFRDHLDDGSPIVVTISIAGDSATIDFDGTGPVLRGNLNANRAIVTAAVMYCFRCLLHEEIPLNQGVLSPLRVVLPESLLSPPERLRPEDCAAVVGGNVETSQRVVDVILGALRLAAASQGTMNNLLFGDQTFGYYETICGGAGATPDGPGADAVHTHMTNTRLTDPEVLELRYPVRLLEFSIRQGSGGAGQHRGGNGIVRRIEFLRDLQLSILSQRRGPYPPFGMQGGAPGEFGKNLLRRADGSSEPLGATAQTTVHPGDVLSIETPGGGGWGRCKR